MKKQFLKFLSQFSQLMPLDALVQWSGQQLFLPFYHVVKDEEDLPHIQHLYPVRTVEQFRADLDYLLEHFKPISLAELKASILEGKALEENCMHLSFDDGLKEVYTIIAPVLEEKGIPATIFLNSNFVDNQALFFRYKISLIIDFIAKNKAVEQTLNYPYPLDKKSLLAMEYEQTHKIDEIASLLKIDFTDFLETQQPYLTSPQIKDLIKRGFTIGGHSVDHPLYAGLTLDEQLEQTEKSIQFVQDKFDLSYRVFSFPFTDSGVGNTFFEIVETDEIAELTFACAGLKQKEFPFHLQRFPMEATSYDAGKLVATEYFYYLAKSPFGKNYMQRS